MGPFVREILSAHSPESLVERLQGESGTVLLRTSLFESCQSRYSLVTARPFLTFRSWGSRCELSHRGGSSIQYGNPWLLLTGLIARFEMIEELDLPFPLGGCFGYWGYELKNFVEPSLPRRAIPDLDLPDCQLAFHSSLVVFDHQLGKTWIVSTGMGHDGVIDAHKARLEADFWERLLAGTQAIPPTPEATAERHAQAGFSSSLSRNEFIGRVEEALAYIRAGDIYQVNLSHRLRTKFAGSGWELFQRLARVSPAPYSAYLDCGEFQIASSSPEQFLRLSGAHIQTRPIKGTRPRSSDPSRDAQLSFELQTSAKEISELVMITDLLRNDLGRVCEFGSVMVPELVRLERYPQVQHLVSTVEGRLRPGVSHLESLAACFPGGSITGAPKVRAMEIIDELEPATRGPYTGALGYVGFNRESQLSILIRSAIVRPGEVFFQVGAGIVADSNPATEYEETLAKAAGLLAALHYPVGELERLRQDSCLRAERSS